VDFVLELLRLVAARAAPPAGSAPHAPLDVDMESDLQAPPAAAGPRAEEESAADSGVAAGDVEDAAAVSAASTGAGGGGGATGGATGGGGGGGGAMPLPAALVRTAAEVGVLLLVKVVSRRDPPALSGRCAAAVGDVLDATLEGSLALLRRAVMQEPLPPPAVGGASWLAKLLVAHPVSEARAALAAVLLRAARRALGGAGAAPGGGAVDGLAEALLRLGPDAAVQWAESNSPPREEAGQLDAYLGVLAELARAGGLSQEQADRLVAAWVDEARAGADSRPALVRRIAQVPARSPPRAPPPAARATPHRSGRSRRVPCGPKAIRTRAVRSGPARLAS
jgi:hypothetical protein